MDEIRIEDRRGDRDALSEMRQILRVGGESAGLIREGRIGTCHMKYGGCAS